MSKKIVLASNNKKKMKEMQELLAPMGAEVIRKVLWEFHPPKNLSVPLWKMR